MRRLHDASNRNRGQQAGHWRLSDTVLGRRWRIEEPQAARRAAIGGPALHHAGEARRHFGMLAIDAMADQEADRRQAWRNGLPVELLGLDLGDESGRTELVADETGGDARRAIETAAARQQAQQQEGNGTVHERLSLTDPARQGPGRQGEPSGPPNCFSPSSKSGWPTLKSAGRFGPPRAFLRFVGGIFWGACAGGRWWRGV